MSKRRRKKRPPKRVLALPDLELSKAAVLNSLTSRKWPTHLDSLTDTTRKYVSGSFNTVARGDEC